MTEETNQEEMNVTQVSQLASLIRSMISDTETKLENHILEQHKQNENIDRQIKNINENIDQQLTNVNSTIAKNKDNSDIQTNCTNVVVGKLHTTLTDLSNNINNAYADEYVLKSINSNFNTTAALTNEMLDVKAEVNDLTETFLKHKKTTSDELFTLQDNADDNQFTQLNLTHKVNDQQLEIEKLHKNVLDMNHQINKQNKIIDDLLKTVNASSKYSTYNATHNATQNTNHNATCNVNRNANAINNMNNYRQVQYAQVPTHVPHMQNQMVSPTSSSSGQMLSKSYFSSHNYKSWFKNAYGKDSLVRFERALSQNIVLEAVNINTANINFMITGTNGDLYVVELHPNIQCSCPDFKTTSACGKKCKHIYFISSCILRFDNPEKQQYSKHELLSRINAIQSQLTCSVVDTRKEP